MLKKICSIICVVIGIAVIILGATFSGEPAGYTSASGRANYKAGDYSVKSASFGADFYTYVYGSTDTIVDELNEINHAAEKIVDGENNIQSAVSSNVEATNGVIRAVNSAAKFLIISIGLGILAFGLTAVGKAFEPAAALANAAPMNAPVAMMSAQEAVQEPTEEHNAGEQ